MNERTEFCLITALVAAFFIAFASPLVISASANARLVAVFSTDEAWHLDILAKCISQRTINIEYKSYGHLFFNIGLLPLVVLSFFTNISDQIIIIVLRCTSTLFAIATVLVSFVISRRYFGRLAGYLTIVFLSIVPLNFLHWSVTSHPDTAQLFFLGLGLYFCCRLTEEDTTKWLVWASAAAGFAFATKYSGLFLLPLIWGVGIAQTMIKTEPEQSDFNPLRIARILRSITGLVGIISILIGLLFTADFVAKYLIAEDKTIPANYLEILDLIRIVSIIFGAALIFLSIAKNIWFKIAQTPKITGCLGKVLLSLLGFGFAFTVSSPASYVRLQFIQGLIFESLHTKFGHAFAASGNQLAWFKVLVSPDLIDLPIIGLTVISGIFLFSKLIGKHWNRIISPECVLWAWVILNLGYLILLIDMRPPRFILPIVPFMIILATVPVGAGYEFLKKKMSGHIPTIIPVAIFLILAGFEISTSLGKAIEYRESVTKREQLSPSVQAGNWIAKNYPKSSRIYCDYYSYVPPRFEDVYFTWGGTLEILAELEPGIVITNQEISGRYSDLDMGENYFDGKDEFLKKHEYYKSLLGTNIGYRVIRSFGDVRVYAKK